MQIQSLEKELRNSKEKLNSLYSKFPLHSEVTRETTQHSNIILSVDAKVSLLRNSFTDGKMIDDDSRNRMISDDVSKILLPAQSIISFHVKSAKRLSFFFDIALPLIPRIEE